MGQMDGGGNPGAQTSVTASMNMKNAALCALLVAPLLTPSAQAQSALTQAEALTRLFSAPEIKAEWFAPEFLQKAPLTLIQGQLGSIAAQYGNFVRLDTYQGHPLAVYERGTLVVVAAAQDAQGRLTSFGAVPGPDPSLLNQTADDKQAIVQALDNLLAVSPVDTSLLSAAFLEAVPEAKIKPLFSAYREQLGAFKGAEWPSEGAWLLHFEKGDVPVLAAQLDDQGKFVTLRLGEVRPSFGSPAEARPAFAALPGDVSVFVSEVGAAAPLLALNAARPLGVGSTFKLGILSEVQARVNAGTLKWTDQVTLTDAMKSLPSGTLQDAPAGSKYTVQDLALRMIRDSDNTATDLLLELAGRQGVERWLGQSAIPSTREFFALKNPANIELLRAYRAAGLNTAARREVLKQADSAPLPTVADFDGSRTLARDVEWFVSTQRLCQLMNNVAALPATQANPGLVNKADYASVSFKGGSEPGVLNLTTQVKTKAGKTYCVSATWNNSVPLNDAAFMDLYKGLMDSLR